jgi:hypothetical protein
MINNILVILFLPEKGGTSLWQPKMRNGQALKK